MKLGVQGHFDIFKCKADGSIVEEYHFDNLILDSGLDLIGSLHNVGSHNINVASYCHIGAGNAEPNFSQTGLSQHVAVSNSTNSNVEWLLDTDEKSKNYTFRYTFNAGVATGNLTEIGVSNSNNKSKPLFSRTLIKDNKNQPTVITKLADEILYVYYTLRVVISHQDVTGICTIGGEQYNYIIRPSSLGLGLSDFIYAYSGNLGNITSSPYNRIGYGDGVNFLYQSSSYKKKYKLNFPINQANHINGLLSVCFMGIFGICWQCQYNRVSDGKAIPKDNTKTLSLDFELSWGRADVT